jgi:uncharacterized protein
MSVVDALRDGESLPPALPPPLPGPVLLTQRWHDMVLVHWAVEASSVSHLFPEATRPDLLHGRTYVGVVAFAASSTRLAGAIQIGAMKEVNVRLYSVDGRGRQGVVFLSMDVTRPDMVLAARALLRLPYLWSRIESSRPYPTAAGFRVRRRPPSRLDTSVEMDARPPVTEQTSPLERFLTARWGLHTRTALGTAWVPITHPPLPLSRGTLARCDESLVEAAGVPAPTAPPISVLWSPGADAKVGWPTHDR